MKWIKFFALGSFYAFFCPLLFATVITPPTKSPEEILKTLMETNQLVVIGSISSQSSEYDDSYFTPQGSIIVTNYVIQIEKVLKGKKTLKEIIIKVPGGCVEEDDRCFITDIAPKFYEGEKYLLFLNPTGGGKWYLWDPIYGKQVYHAPYFSPLGLTLDEITYLIEGGSK